MRGYLVRPVDQSGDLPAVIVVHENRGLNEHIRDVTRRMALEGFVALAPDFLSPLGGTPQDEDQAREMFSQLDAGQTRENGVATVAYLMELEGSNGNVGAIGFCWGGGTVNSIAVGAPDLKAGVAYYGAQPNLEEVENIEAAMMLHYAGQDERINAGIESYRQALETAGKEFTIHMYEGKQHAFNNDTSEARYDKEAADLAWGRTVEFLKEKLS
jgi:carboxymethylenebutenolidase